VLCRWVGGCEHGREVEGYRGFLVDASERWKINLSRIWSERLRAGVACSSGGRGWRGVGWGGLAALGQGEGFEGLFVCLGVLLGFY